MGYNLAMQEWRKEYILGNIQLILCISSKVHLTTSQRVDLLCGRFIHMYDGNNNDHRTPRATTACRVTECVAFQFDPAFSSNEISTSYLILSSLLFSFFVWTGPCQNFSRMRIVFEIPSHTSYVAKCKSFKLQLFNVWLFYTLY